LATESELLLALRPKFNRAGTWPAPGRHLAWRSEGARLELAVLEEPEEGWQARGPISGARYLRTALARLLWLAAHPGSSIADLPAGWFRGAQKMRHVILCDEPTEQLTLLLEELRSGQVEKFSEWARARVANADTLTLAVVEEDLESISKMFLHS